MYQQCCWVSNCPRNILDLLRQWNCFTSTIICMGELGDNFLPQTRLSIENGLTAAWREDLCQGFASWGIQQKQETYFAGWILSDFISTYFNHTWNDPRMILRLRFHLAKSPNLLDSRDPFAPLRFVKAAQQLGQTQVVQHFHKKYQKICDWMMRMTSGFFSDVYSFVFQTVKC